MNRVSKDEDLHELLKMIRPRPGLYLGTNSLRSLYQFLNGFFYAQYK